MMIFLYVCFTPENIQHKDINDMVSSGIRDIKKLIDENTYRGLEGSKISDLTLGEK